MDPDQYILRAEQQKEAPQPPNGIETLPGLLEWQARRRKDAPFLTFQSQEDLALQVRSYAQVFDMARKLAKAIRVHLDWPAPGTFVAGIWLEKSIELHLAIFAATLSGGAWLPFDADAPASRVSACLGDSKSQILLCDDLHLEGALEATRQLEKCKVITVTQLIELADQLVEQDLEQVLPRPHAKDAAYFIYTSGSTGTPKGIEISHGAALTFALSERTVLQTEPHDIVWQGFSAAFDMFIEEVWVSIAGGAQLAIGSRAECRNVPQLGGGDGIWAKRGVTLVNAVPTLINIMTSLDDDTSLPSSIRLLNLGGEACPPALVSRLWHPRLRIVNTYGPSETTVTATFQELTPNIQVTIGKPLPSYHALLLRIEEDDCTGSSCSAKFPLPLLAGAEGELAIGGPCLGNGYVERPALTAEKFIDHPFPADGPKLYRTGDRVRLDQDLNLIFCGRIDTQVKHRGFRIELGEIENAIAGQDGVQTAAVILSQTSNKLEAYIVVRQGIVVSQANVRAKLRHLPAYMMPEAFFFIEAQDMPRLPSGKINVKALQDTSKLFARQEAELAAQQAVKTCALPTTTYTGEMGTLIDALSAVFPQATSIAPTSDFFDELGGHSLAAAVLVSRLRKEGGTSSPFSSMGLQDIYVGRTPVAILEQVMSRFELDSEGADDDDEVGKMRPAELEGQYPRAQHRAITNTRFVLCGLAQIPALLLIWFFQSVQIIVPYFAFYGVLHARDLGSAIIVAYLIFVVTNPLLTIIAIAGKWIVLGKAREGEYPLYGVYYYRWWLAGRLMSLIDLSAAADTPLQAAIMRLFGARVGLHCHMGAVDAAFAFDLVEIGSDVVIGKDVHLATSIMEHGKLVLKPIRIGSHAFIGSNCLLEGGAVVEEGAEVKAMSMVPSGRIIPAGQRWHGSPARFLETVHDVGNMSMNRPSEMHSALLVTATTFATLFVFPLINFAAQIPSLMLFEVLKIPGMDPFAQTAVVAIPASLVYMFILFAAIVSMKFMILGTLKEGTYSIVSAFYFRKWFVDRLMDMSLLVLHPVYATLYVVPFLRCIGVKIGRMAEVSTARGINFNLTEIGDESFVADGVMLGDAQVRHGTLILQKTVLGDRAFAGNASLLPQGTHLASNTLVGVLSIAPDQITPLENGQSCFGTPPVLMPARQKTQTAHAAKLLYSPSKGQVALRLFIEGMRIFLPRILIVYGLGMGVQVFQISYEHIGVAQTLLMLPLFFFFFFSLPSLFFVVGLKWLLVGRYEPDEWPLWSVNVWLSEFVTSTYETLLSPLLTNMLVGTPYLAWVFRMLGVQIGARTALMSNDITEYDLVSLGQESIINMHAGPQTHLFEDRVMKLGRVDVEDFASMNPYSISLPGSRICHGAQLGSLSLVMKGESVPAGEEWEGAPIAPRRRPKPYGKVAPQALVATMHGSSSASLCVHAPRLGRHFEKRSSSSRMSSVEDGPML